MERYEKSVSKKGKTYDVVLVTFEDVMIVATDNNHSSTNYVNPPIPGGYSYVCGEWYNGFVIKRYSDGSQFVWVPVGSLDSNGTLDGKNFSEKFGRRNYLGEDFYDSQEVLEGELLNQWNSVQKYGGFYISRYAISKNEQTGDAQSVKGKMPWTKIDWFDAMNAAGTFGDGISVTSHLLFGAEFDSVLEWFIKSDKRTREEIVKDSSSWGNYDTGNILQEVVKTGTRKKWSTNHISDFAGNICEWTQEGCEYWYSPCTQRIVRGGSDFPVAARIARKPSERSNYTGFRAALCFK